MGSVQQKRYWWRHLWLIGVALYLVALWFIGWDKLRAAITGINLYWFAATVVVLFAAQWLRALKWLYALGPRRNAIGIHFLSKAAGEWSPGRMGEFAPLLMPAHRNARVGAWIAVDRLLEMTGTLALGIVGFAGLQFANRRVMLGLAAAVMVCIVLAFYALSRRSLFERLALRFPEGTRRRRIGVMLTAMSHEVRLSFAKLPVTGSLTLIACLLDLLVAYLLLGSFGYPLGFYLLAAGKCLHALVAALPVTPNATGVPFFTTAVLFHEVAGVPEGVLAAVIGLSIVITNLVFWSSFGLGALDMRRRPAPLAEPSKD